jgi:hypothetical protein
MQLQGLPMGRGPFLFVHGLSRADVADGSAALCGRQLLASHVA